MGIRDCRVPDVRRYNEMMTRMSIPEAMELAMGHHRAGNLSQAESIYRQILATQPDQADAMHLLGLVELGRGRFGEALELIDRAIGRHGDEPAYHYSRGQVFQAWGKGAQAIDAYRRAISLRADFAEALNNLGALLTGRGELAAAIEALRRAVAVRPDAAECWNNLSTAFLKHQQLDEAIQAAQRAVALKPDFVAGHVSLGLAYQRADDPGRAIGSFEQALRLSPGSNEAGANLGMALASCGRFSEGMEQLRRVLSRVPDQAQAHYALSRVLLLMGELREGWRESEWRWKVPELQSRRLPVATPWWDGIESLADKDILVWPEQGLGDTIHFSRYVPLVARQARRVILMCQPPLVELLGRIEGASRTIAVGDPVPAHDVHVPMMSLPMVFGPDSHGSIFPPPSRSVAPRTELIEHWRGRLGDSGGRLRIGLVWTANPLNQYGQRRSIDPALLAPLGSVENVRFVSLQKFPEGVKANTTSPPLEILDVTAELTDLAETAALIENLDLVITVDTAVAHLAGTLGKPVWILLAFVPDWRWGLGRSDNPWYPAARLFRQPVAGDWDSVIGHVRQALAERVGGRSTSDSR